MTNCSSAHAIKLNSDQINRIRARRMLLPGRLAIDVQWDPNLLVLRHIVRIVMEVGVAARPAGRLVRSR